MAQEVGSKVKDCMPVSNVSAYTENPVRFTLFHTDILRHPRCAGIDQTSVDFLSMFEGFFDFSLD